MPIADMLSTGGQVRSLSPLPYNPTTFGEVNSARLADAWYNNPVGPGGSDFEQASILEKRNTALQQVTGIDVLPEARKKAGSTWDAGLMNSVAPSVQIKRQQEEANAIRDSLITAGRLADPEKYAAIKTTKEISDEIATQRKSVRATADEITMKGEDDFARVGGSLSAGLLALPMDPINLATLPFGAGAATGILRAMRTEALLNMGIEAAEIPFIKKNEESLGAKYGPREMAIGVATAGIGAAGLTGAIRGGARALDVGGAKLNKFRTDTLDKIATNPTVPSEVRDAANYMSRYTRVDEEIEPSLRENMAAVEDAQRQMTAANRKNLEEVQAALREYREPKIEGVRTDTAIRLVEREVPTSPRIQEKPDEFMAGNKAVDPEGKPIVVLHGTPEKGIGIPDPKKAMEVPGATFFTDNADIAEQYRFTREYGEIVGEEQGDLIRANISMKNPMEVDYRGGVGEAIALTNLVKEAKAKGHDGLIIRNVDDSVDSSGVTGTTYAVFNKNQIREAAVTQPSRVSDGVTALENDLVHRPNDVAASMAKDIEAAEKARNSETYKADFERMAAERPDETILTDDGEMTFAELAEMIKEREDELLAIRTCAIGG